MMRKILTGMIALLVLVSCSKNETGFQLEGEINNAEGLSLELMGMVGNNLEVLDSVTLDAEGVFKMSGELENPNFFMLVAEQDNYLTLIIHPGEKVSIEADGSELMKTYSVKGSKDSKHLQEYYTELVSTMDELSSLSKMYYDSISSPNISSIMDEINRKSDEAIAEIREFTIDFIETNEGCLATLIALYQQTGQNQYILDPIEDMRYYVTVDSVLYEKYPQSAPVQALHENMAQLKEQQKLEELRNATLGIGKTPPEIALPTPQGDTLKLSDMKGKIILLDFWAAWCSPCRKENPNLVDNYNKYHEKGFDIFQVSLDKTKENWLKGIEEDKLGRWHHVSDLAYWNSSVVPLYQIQGIPASFLLDREGRIIGTNLRGPALGAKLEELFGE